LAFDSAQALQPHLAAAHRAASIIVMAIAFSVVVYLVIGFLVVGEPDESLSPQARVPFYVTAILLAFGSIALRRVELRWAKLQAVAEHNGVEAVLRHLTNVAILSSVLGEVVGLLGLLLVILGGDQAGAFRLCAVALVTVLLNYPRRNAWEQTIEYLARSAMKSAPEA
jgi:hypothetical protein